MCLISIESSQDLDESSYFIVIKYSTESRVYSYIKANL
jgi:hypothetical protein